MIGGTHDYGGSSGRDPPGSGLNKKVPLWTRARASCQRMWSIASHNSGPGRVDQELGANDVNSGKERLDK